MNRSPFNFSPFDSMVESQLGRAYTNLQTVAENISDVEVVIGNIGDIQAVAGSLDGVQTLADNIADVVSVADNLAEVIGNTSGLATTIADYAIDPTGLTDSTDGLTSLFTNNTRVYIGPGRYLIAGKGPDTGGVNVTVTHSITVECHPNAVFFTDNLDNDLIRFSVPSDGNGLPTEPIEIRWRGGYFDQTNQKISTSVPYSVEYPAPAGKQGASATADGLSIRCSYTVGGVVKGAAKLVEISGATFYSGPHWQNCGGDGNIFAGEGASNTIIERCTFTGSRDAAIYVSRDGTGAVGDEVTIRDNRFYSCFYGSTVKRGFRRAQMYGNYYDNCIHGPISNVIAGLPIKNEGVAIFANTINRCHIGVRVDYTLGPKVYDNTIRNLGCYLADGVTPFPQLVASGIALAGCIQGKVFANTIAGVGAGLTASSLYGIELNDYNVDGTLVPTTCCSVSDNDVADIRSIGREQGSANDNYWLNNRSLNTTNTTITLIGARSIKNSAYDTSASGHRHFVGNTETFRETSAEVRLTLPLRTNGYTVAQLFALASPQDGWRAHVTDCTVTLTSANYGSQLLSTQGGGSNKIPVVYLGGWKLG